MPVKLPASEDQATLLSKEPSYRSRVSLLDSAAGTTHHRQLYFYKFAGANIAVIFSEIGSLVGTRD